MLHGKDLKTEFLFVLSLYVSYTKMFRDQKGFLTHERSLYFRFIFTVLIHGIRIERRFNEEMFFRRATYIDISWTVIRDIVLKNRFTKVEH